MAAADNQRATENRSSAAYWYAVGRNDEKDTNQIPPEEFAEYARKQAEDYYAGRTWHLTSVAQQWQKFIAQRAPAPGKQRRVTVRLDEVLDGIEKLRAVFAALNYGRTPRRFLLESVGTYPIEDYTGEDLTWETAMLPFRSVSDQCLTFLVEYEADE